MLATALIVFREVLEAALIVSIITAATRGVAGRGYWISGGIAGGLAGAAGVAAMAGFLASAFDGAGQDIVNASIAFLAVGLIGWHVVWMNSHGRALAAQMRAVGKSVTDGTQHLSVLAVVVGLAVMREGSEVALMLQGLWASAEGSMLSGALLGLASGVVAGSLLYVGFTAMPVARMFALTNGLLVLIAAGMAAHGANFLAQAGLIPSLGGRLWDTSAVLSEQSAVGQLLGAMIGYIARPSGVEVLFYGVTVATVVAFMARARRHMIGAAAGAMLVLTALIFAAPAHADEVLSPYVVKGEAELENQGYVSRDRDASNRNEQAHIAALGLSPTDFWRVEFEGEFARDPGPGQTTRYSSFNLENTFQLTEPGEYWIDSGLFYEMDFARDPASPNNIIFGYIGAKTVGPIEETFNLLAHKDYGANATPMGFIYSNQAKYRLRSWFEPGFEIFGDTSGKARFDDQKFSVGPGIFGLIHTFNGQALKYQLGYQFGATSATPDGAVRWKLEYEFYF